MRLSSYPFVVVRIACRLCRRQGHRLARLAERFGAETEVEAVLDALTADCAHKPDPRRRRRHRYSPDICHAELIDLVEPRLPPDLPPGLGGLRVIEGGRSDDQAAEKATRGSKS